MRQAKVREFFFEGQAFGFFGACESLAASLVQCRNVPYGKVSEEEVILFGAQFLSDLWQFGRLGGVGLESFCEISSVYLMISWVGLETDRLCLFNELLEKYWWKKVVFFLILSSSNVTVALI
jgi:hypothetical protein